MRRPAPQRDMPPPLELECLKALWGIGEGTVRDVRHVILRFCFGSRRMLRPIFCHRDAMRSAIRQADR